MLHWITVLAEFGKTIAVQLLLETCTVGYGDHQIAMVQQLLLRLIVHVEGCFHHRFSTRFIEGFGDFGFRTRTSGQRHGAHYPGVIPGIVQGQTRHDQQQHRRAEHLVLGEPVALGVADAHQVGEQVVPGDRAERVRMAVSTASIFPTLGAALVAYLSQPATVAAGGTRPSRDST